MLEGFKKIADGVQEIFEPINPMVTDMDEKNKAIATAMLEEGISVKDIQHFVDVSRAQLDAFLEVEAKVIARVKATEAVKDGK